MRPTLKCLLIAAAEASSRPPRQRIDDADPHFAGRRVGPHAEQDDGVAVVHLCQHRIGLAETGELIPGQRGPAGLKAALAGDVDQPLDTRFLVAQREIVNHALNREIDAMVPRDRGQALQARVRRCLRG